LWLMHPYEGDTSVISKSRRKMRGIVFP